MSRVVNGKRSRTTSQTCYLYPRPVCMPTVHKLFSLEVKAKCNQREKLPFLQSYVQPVWKLHINGPLSKQNENISNSLYEDDRHLSPWVSDSFTFQSSWKAFNLLNVSRMTHHEMWAATVEKKFIEMLDFVPLSFDIFELYFVTSTHPMTFLPTVLDFKMNEPNKCAVTSRVNPHYNRHWPNWMLKTIWKA